jgi:cytochrome oxidase Cu insertion factor (SCO1/SenC/PrrC family)
MARPRLDWLFGGAVVLALILTGCGPDPRQQRALEPVKVGSQAPAFTLETPEGKPISLADYRDRRPVLLYFSMGPG